MEKELSFHDRELHVQLSALLRQYRYPKEFRISRIAIPGTIHEALMEAIEGTKNEAVHVPDTGRTDNTDDVRHIRFINDLATGLWRLRKRIFDEETGEPKSEMKMLYRHFETTWDVLTNAGVDIQDHTGDAYDSGLSLKVLTFQPLPDLGREVVIETIKPSVYLHDRHIQTGEVIVGVPTR